MSRPTNSYYVLRAALLSDEKLDAEIAKAKGVWLDFCLAERAMRTTRKAAT